MMDIFLDLIINGTIISGVILLICDAVKLLSSNSAFSGGAIYNTDYSKIDFDKRTVTYDSLPHNDEENIKNVVGVILSGIMTIVSLIFELILDMKVQIILCKRILYSIIVGILIAAILLSLKWLISISVIKIINIYARRNGLVRKLPDNAHIIR